MVGDGGRTFTRVSTDNDPEVLWTVEDGIVLLLDMRVRTL